MTAGGQSRQDHTFRHASCGRPRSTSTSSPGQPLRNPSIPTLFFQRPQHCCFRGVASGRLDPPHPSPRPTATRQQQQQRTNVIVITARIEWRREAVAAVWSVSTDRGSVVACVTYLIDLSLIAITKPCPNCNLTCYLVWCYSITGSGQFDLSTWSCGCAQRHDRTRCSTTTRSYQLAYWSHQGLDMPTEWTSQIIDKPTTTRSSKY